MIRILHTSDWHLGRSFHFHSLQDDQRHALRQVREELARDYQAVVISGDIYDRAVPSVQAVKMFGDFLKEVRSLNVACIIIPGNHDSAERLGFADAILEPTGIHLRCDYTRLCEPVTIFGKAGEAVDIFALPFVETGPLRQILGDDAITSVQTATEKAIQLIRERRRPGFPAVLMAHAFVGESALVSDSERLFIGGAERVSAEAFNGFDYVALGHLHKPQRIHSDTIRYSGSLLPYSFSEIDYPKEMVRIEFTDAPTPTIRSIPIEPLHPVSIIENRFESVLNDSKYDAQADDFVSIRLTDESYHVDTFYRIKQRFRLLCELRQMPLEARESNAVDLFRKTKTGSPEDIVDLFLDYFGWEDVNQKNAAKDLLIKGYRKAESEKRQRES